MPKANTEGMKLHLRAISKEVPLGRHALIVVDGATWHNKAAYEGLNNLTLIKLPPVSPELNPVEKIWLYLRQNYLANQAFRDYEHIVDCCCSAWNQFAEQGELIASMTH